MNESNTPLVSIVVITYNSSEFILETLESARMQKYHNIELIISDDCSLDNTIDICKGWLRYNKSRFVRTQLISVEDNTGLPANCNRGIIAAKGDWIKLLAGDDILLPNCISSNLDYIFRSNKNIEVLQSNSRYFRGSFSEETIFFNRDVTKNALARHENAEYQFKILLWAPSVNAPTIFIKRILYKRLGLYDESIRFMEDWPMWLKISKSGVIIHSHSSYTVAYRIHEGSISNNGYSKVIFSQIYTKLYEFSRLNAFPFLSICSKFFLNYDYFIKRSFDIFRLNRNRFYLKSVYLLALTPYLVYRKCRELIYYIKT
jgi:glycosyltransferase involved in cell wall biosynthesis